jgi:hypothetical protein
MIRTGHLDEIDAAVAVLVAGDLSQSGDATEPRIVSALDHVDQEALRGELGRRRRRDSRPPAAAKQFNCLAAIYPLRDACALVDRLSCSNSITRFAR